MLVLTNNLWGLYFYLLTNNLWGLFFYLHTEAQQCTLRSRLLGASNYHFMWFRACHVGWAEQPTPCFICKNGAQTPFEEPSAPYTVDGTMRILAPKDGKPTWFESIVKVEGAAGPASLTQALSKFERSIDTGYQLYGAQSLLKFIGLVVALGCFGCHHESCLH